MWVCEALQIQNEWTSLWNSWRARLASASGLLSRTPHWHLDETHFHTRCLGAARRNLSSAPTSWLTGRKSDSTNWEIPRTIMSSSSLKSTVTSSIYYCRVVKALTLWPGEDSGSLPLSSLQGLALLRTDQYSQSQAGLGQECLGRKQKTAVKMHFRNAVDMASCASFHQAQDSPPDLELCVLYIYIHISLKLSVHIQLLFFIFAKHSHNSSKKWNKNRKAPREPPAAARPQLG